MTAPPLRAPWLAVALLSAAALGYEVLLTRLFAVIFWDHLAHLVISLALLGYGASGAFLALTRNRLQRHFAAAFTANVAAFAIAAPLCFAIAQALPFNPLELAWAPLNWLWFGAIYLTLSLPFLGAANAIALALWHDAGGLHRVYAADLAGAGLGALGIVGLLFLVTPGEALRTLTILGVLCTAVAAWQTRLGARRALTGLALAAAAALWVLPPGWFAPQPSAFKALPQALATRGAEIMIARSSPLGELTVVRNEAVPFRIAPGMSLATGRQPPPQLGLFRDGDLAGPVTTEPADPTRLAYLDALPSAFPYHLLRAAGTARPRVLLPGAGTGEGVRQARYLGAASVEVTEHDPALRRLLTQDLAAPTGRLFDGVIVHPVAVRAFTAGRRGALNLVQLDTGGPGSSGLGALAATRDLTREAFGEYLRLLTPAGLLAVTHPLQAPPRTVPRLILTAIETLEARGADPGACLMVIRAWRTATLVVKPRGFTSAEIAAARDFSRARAFDLVYLPDLRRADANRYNLLPEPLLYDTVQALLSSGRADFVARYKFDLAPVIDDRPFLHHGFRWSTLPELWRSLGAGTAAQLEWGYLILLATLVQATVLSVLFILVPTLMAGARAGITDGAAPGRVKVVLYFGALGLAFIFVEIAFIHSLQRLLQDPLFAVAAVLASFLTFAGLGSRLAPPAARRAERLTGGRRPWPIFIGIGIAAMLPLMLLPWLVDWVGAWPLWARFALAILLVAPLALLMGMPFPLGLARVAAAAPQRLPLAWAVNGCLSVIGAIAAQITTLAVGFTGTVAVGVLFYLLAAGAVPATPVDTS